jgi:hypothetical protein
LKKTFCLLFVLLLSSSAGSAQAATGVRLQGYSLTDLYALQDAADNDHQILYETFFFHLDRPGRNRFSLVSHLRYEGDFYDHLSNSGEFKAHNLYLRWGYRLLLDARAGRQFLAEGVTIGTYDVLRVQYAPDPRGSLTIFGGSAAPYDRKLEMRKFDEAPAIGVALRGKPTANLSLLGSYLYEERDGVKFRHKAGLSAGMAVSPELYAHALLHWNLNGPSDLDRLRLLLRYSPLDRIRAFGEFALGTPQLPPDSPFQFVEIDTYELIRVGASYRISPNYWLGIRAQSFLAGDAPSTTLGLNLEGPWGVLGYRQRFGDFGDESGFYGSAQYQLLPWAQIYGNADFSVYQFEENPDQDDQLAAQAGLRLQPLSTLTVDGSIQGLKNRQFEDDIRGLLRVKWTFSN